MSALHSSPAMKICEIEDGRRRRPVWVMEQLEPSTKLARPTCWIPEWSSRAEEEDISEDVGCSSAGKENNDD
jgi:hypothetical protein